MEKIIYKKILVTGSGGIAGGALKDMATEFPQYEFIFSRSKDCDLTRKDETMEYVKRTKPDAIIHFAAISGGIGLSMKHPAMLLRDNVLMNINILEAAQEYAVKKTIMTLSTGMYPTAAPIPLREETMHDGVPHESNYSYAYAKRLVQPLIKSYRAEYGMSVIGLIPNGIIGEHMNYNTEMSTMPAALIRRFFENKDNGTDIVVWGDGSPLREFTYAKDIARIYIWCLENYDNEQVINIGNAQEISIKDFAYMFADALKIDRKRIAFDTTKPAGQFRKGTDNSKFMGLSHFTYTPMKEAIENTIKYFVQYYPDSTKLHL